MATQTNRWGKSLVYGCTDRADQLSLSVPSQTDLGSCGIGAMLTNIVTGENRGGIVPPPL